MQDKFSRTLTAQEIRDIETRAYIPEHIISYVSAVSYAVPGLIENYLYYKGKENVVFIGYPLSGEFKKEIVKNILNQVSRAYYPKPISIIAPEDICTSDLSLTIGSDDYYRIELSRLEIKQKVRNMVLRASRELKSERSDTFKSCHEDLVKEFLESRDLDPATVKIFQNLKEYVASSDRVIVLSAWKGEMLAAFDIVDTTSESYAFYMFNFSSKNNYVPGASDLLFNEIINIAKERRKKFINMGLGIHQGIRRFKEKWGGTPFLHYKFRLISPSNHKKPGFRSIFLSLFRRQSDPVCYMTSMSNTESICEMIF